MYHISDYTKNKAKQLGVEVKPSARLHKKIDVYKNGKYLDSVGDNRYGDYSAFIKTFGKEYADERRRLYHLRHKGNTLGERLARDLLW